MRPTFTLNDLRDEIKGDEIKTVKIEEIWYFMETPSGMFYSPFTKSKHQLKYFESAENMASALAEKDAYEVVTNNLVEIYEIKVPNNPPTTIPNGVYSHEFGGGSLPERLIPITTRSDKYIELLDNLTELDSSVDQFLQNKWMVPPL